MRRANKKRAFSRSANSWYVSRNRRLPNGFTSYGIKFKLRINARICPMLRLVFFHSSEYILNAMSFALTGPIKAVPNPVKNPSANFWQKLHNGPCLAWPVHSYSAAPFIRRFLPVRVAFPHILHVENNFPYSLPSLYFILFYFIYVCMFAQPQSRVFWALNSISIPQLNKINPRNPCSQERKKERKRKEWRRGQDLFNLLMKTPTQKLVNN